MTKKRGKERIIQKIVVSPYIPGENVPIEDIKRGIIMIAFGKVLPMPLEFKTAINNNPAENISLILCFVYEELENGGAGLTGGIFPLGSDCNNFKNAFMVVETTIDPPRC